MTITDTELLQELLACTEPYPALGMDDVLASKNSGWDVTVLSQALIEEVLTQRGAL